jgi:hypothetical protein
MVEDPVHSPAFISTLLHFRIDRLEEELLQNKAKNAG